MLLTMLLSRHITRAVNQYSIANGCVPFAWDTNALSHPNMTVINRSGLSIINQYMMSRYQKVSMLLHGLIREIRIGLFLEK